MPEVLSPARPVSTGTDRYSVSLHVSYQFVSPRRPYGRYQCFPRLGLYSLVQGRDRCHATPRTSFVSLEQPPLSVSFSFSFQFCICRGQVRYRCRPYLRPQQCTVGKTTGYSVSPLCSSYHPYFSQDKVSIGVERSLVLVVFGAAGECREVTDE